MKLSLCIVGCGEYARTVLKDVREMTDELQLFFASRDGDKAKQYCDEYGGGGYFCSYEEAAGDPRVHAMYFLTPHNAHVENATLAARNSKHTLMEKPIARTVTESEEMIRVARDAGVKLMVAENVRFFPVVERSVELFRQGAIGDLRLVQIIAERYKTYPGWRRDLRAMGGGVFIDGGIHFVDLMRLFGGTPERVYASKLPQVQQEIEGEDGIVVVASLPGGGSGLINYSDGTPMHRPGYRQISVTGTKGCMTFDLFSEEILLESPEASRTVRVPVARNGSRPMVSEFLSSILEDREPSMTGEEGLEDLRVVLAAYSSAEEGRAVSLAPS